MKRIVIFLCNYSRFNTEGEINQKINRGNDFHGLRTLFVGESGTSALLLSAVSEFHKPATVTGSPQGLRKRVFAAIKPWRLSESSSTNLQFRHRSWPTRGIVDLFRDGGCPFRESVLKNKFAGHRSFSIRHQATCRKDSSPVTCRCVKRNLCNWKTSFMEAVAGETTHKNTQILEAPTVWS